MPQYGFLPPWAGLAVPRAGWPEHVLALRAPARLVKAALPVPLMAAAQHGMLVPAADRLFWVWNPRFS